MLVADGGPAHHWQAAVEVTCKQCLLKTICSLFCVCFISLWCMWCLPDSSAVLEDGIRAVQYQTEVHKL